MLKDTLSQDMKAALKGGDKDRLSVLRFALSKMRECENDEQVLAVLKKLIKSHQDAFGQFSDAGRDDLARKEQISIECLQDYLPEALSEDAVDAAIDQVLGAQSATGMQDMGRVMKALQTSIGMSADMKQVSQKVRERLSKASG